MSILISVVVCTYNRADLLNRCLQSIFEQTCDPLEYEVIVVDNNSKDKTREIVNSFIGHSNLRYFLESRQGLSYARNLGLEKARGDYIAYLDDDVLVPPEWLTNALIIILTILPPLDCLGGPLSPFYSTEKPFWFKDQYELCMYREEPFYLKQGQSLIGANMIWKKDSLKLINGFDVKLGVKGNALVLGEDTAAFYKMWKVKPTPQFYCSPLLLVNHWVSPVQMTVSYRLKRNYAGGIYHYQEFGPKEFSHRIIYIFRKIFILGKSIILSLFHLKYYTTWQNWVIEELSPAALVAGELISSLGISPKLSNEKIK